MLKTKNLSVTADSYFPGDDNYAVVKGKRIRKGSIAATLQNVKTLNCLLSEKPSLQRDQDIHTIVDDIRPIIEGLVATELFDIFSPLEWIANQHNKGRALVGIVCLQEVPALVSEETVDNLKALYPNADPFVQKEMQ